MYRSVRAGLGLLLFALVFPVLCPGTLAAQSPAAGAPKLVRTGNRADLMVDGRPFLMIGGELRNSSSSSVEFMGPIWDHLVSLHVNTVFQGEFVDGKWNTSRVLNGDETGQGLYAVNLPPSSQPVIGEPQLSIVKVRIELTK